MKAEDLGKLIGPSGGRFELMFERRLAKPIEKVWAALTVPERLADWLAEAEIDLRVGGRLVLFWPTHDFRLESRIVALEPPRPSSPGRGRTRTTHTPWSAGNWRRRARAAA